MTEMFESSLGETQRLTGAAIFIDRDGALFAEVLAYLRGAWVAPESPEMLRKLAIEAAFFRIEAMEAAIKAKQEELD